MNEQKNTEALPITHPLTYAKKPVDIDVIGNPTKQPAEPVKPVEPEDPAEVLIRRIERIVKSTGCRHAVAAWAIACAESRTEDRHLHPYPRMEIVPEGYLHLEGPVVHKRST